MIVIPGPPRPGSGRLGRGSRLVAAAALVSVGILAGCSAAGDASEDAVRRTVIAQNLDFVPSSIGVPVGGEIVFSNRDDVSHTVTEGTNGQPVAGARFDEELDASADARVTVAFPEAGVVSITCRIHPTMALTVTVGDGGPATSQAPPTSQGSKRPY